MGVGQHGGGAAWGATDEVTLWPGNKTANAEPKKQLNDNYH